MTTGVMKLKAKRKAVLSQLTVVSVVLKYAAAWFATGEKVSHYQHVRVHFPLSTSGVLFIFIIQAPLGPAFGISWSWCLGVPS